MGVLRHFRRNIFIAIMATFTIWHVYKGTHKQSGQVTLYPIRNPLQLEGRVGTDLPDTDTGSRVVTLNPKRNPLQIEERFSSYPPDTDTWSRLVTLNPKRNHLQLDERVSRFPDTEPGSQCPSILKDMAQGHWKTRKLSSIEYKESEQFFHEGLTSKGVRWSLQRKDGRCWDTPYVNVTKFIRALCSPTGSTPCCYNFKCVDRTEQQCRCENCWDVRQQVLANFSTWVPSDNRCKLKRFSSNQTCELLHGGSVIFVGDSLIQHMFSAFLMILRGNFKDGALRKTAPQEFKSKCSGMGMFIAKGCRTKLDVNPKDICGGSVRLNWMKHFNITLAKEELLNSISEKLGEPQTLFVVGVGIHEDFNASKVQMEYLKPILDKLRNVGNTWPKFLFVDTNAPGVQKASDTQSKSSVLRFNREMETFLEGYNIPVMKTFNMTDGVRSFDGTHYALGVNELKARILLNYIQELSDNGQWNR